MISRWRRLPILALVLGVTALAVLWAAALWSTGDKVFGEGMSPDGSWGLRVVGQRHLTGGYEVVVRHLDAAGTPRPGGFVIGIESGTPPAEKYAVTFDDNETARVGGGRIVRKPKGPS